jgi:hypothetical protein
LEIKREALLKCLRQIGPTIGDKTPLEQLKCFWFDGDNGKAWTYNDVVATEVVFDGDLSGGVGLPLLGLLDNSSAEDVTINITGTELSLVAGGTKGKLSVRGMDEAIYPFPAEDDPDCVTVIMSGAAEDALRHVTTTANDSGVTVVAEDDELAFYSTDIKSISWARIPLPEGYNAPRMLLSPQFCQRLQASMGGSDAILQISEDRIIANFESVMRLFGRLTHDENPRPFREAIMAAIPGDLIGLPPGAAEALKRVGVLVHPGKQDRMRVSLNGKNARFEFKSDLGQLDERFVVEGNKISVEALFDPDVLKTGFDMMTPKLFSLCEQAFALIDDRNFGFVCAAKPE